MCSDGYQIYLKGPEWNQISKECKKRDKYRCRNCGESSNLEVHHICYERNPENVAADKSKLFTLCRKCHDAVQHGRLDINKFINKSPDDFTDPLSEYEIRVLAYLAILGNVNLYKAYIGENPEFAPQPSDFQSPKVRGAVKFVLESLAAGSGKMNYITQVFDYAEARISTVIKDFTEKNGCYKYCNLNAQEALFSQLNNTIGLIRVLKLKESANKEYDSWIDKYLHNIT